VYSSAGDGSAKKRGNPTVHATRICDTKELRLTTQLFIREWRGKQTRMKWGKVLEHMLEKDHITVAKYVMWIFDKRQYATAYRVVGRYLTKLGDVRGRRKGKIVQKQSIFVARDVFLRAFM
jgi:hypothetical protein